MIFKVLIARVILFFARRVQRSRLWATRQLDAQRLRQAHKRFPAGARVRFVDPEIHERPGFSRPNQQNLCGCGPGVPYRDGVWVVVSFDTSDGEYRLRRESAPATELLSVRNNDITISRAYSCGNNLERVA